MSGFRDGSPNNDPLEDDFILALIDSVQRNPCVYNRYDPLHKVTDYKHEIWKMISIEIGYEGQPVELERKWKHMRDKYVRLRKMDKQKAPIKKTNKWYNYYRKMSFLDPYVEHRNRKRQKDFMDEDSPEPMDDDQLYFDELGMKDILKTEPSLSASDCLDSPQTSSSRSSRNHNPDSPTEDMDDEKRKLLMIYDKILAESQVESSNGIKVTLHSDSGDYAAPTEHKSSRKRKPIPTQIIQETTPPPPPEKIIRAEPLEDPLKGHDENQVTLFIRSLSKALVEMDRQKFAMARIEISKVLYNLEFGTDKKTN